MTFEDADWTGHSRTLMIVIDYLLPCSLEWYEYSMLSCDHFHFKALLLRYWHKYCRAVALFVKFWVSSEGEWVHLQTLVVRTQGKIVSYPRTFFLSWAWFGQFVDYKGLLGHNHPFKPSLFSRNASFWSVVDLMGRGRWDGRMRCSKMSGMFLFLSSAATIVWFRWKYCH